MKGRFILVFSAFFLLATYFVSIWMVNLEAPQYPEGLRMYVYPTKITGDVNKLNILNHYIGMKHISKDEFPEFKILTIFLGVMAGLSLLVAGIGKKHLLPIMFLSFVIIGIYFLFRLDDWLYRYGHEFDPKAAMDIPPFKPPMFGSMKFANFTVINYFHIGAIFMGMGPILWCLAMLDFKLFNKNKKKKSEK